MTRGGTKLTTGQDRGRLPPCVCNMLPDGRTKAMRLTSKGRRALEVARPLWAQAQGKVLRELGTKAWTDAQRQLTRLHHVAVKKRQLGREGRRVHSKGRRVVD